MPYVPTPEKLAALPSNNGYRASVVANEVMLEFEVAVGRENGTHQLFVACPSEQFFDELLVAIGWV